MLARAQRDCSRVSPLDRIARDGHTARVKLLVAIVHPDDSGGMVDALLKSGYRTTRLQSSGGFLKKTSATLLVGVDEEAVDDVIAVIRAHSKARVVDSDKAPRKVSLGAAVVFVVPIERFDRV
jgi:uncharacterized protein YaaQ